jgi:hypothetical protein
VIRAAALASASWNSGILLHWLVEIDLAALHQLHDGQSCERFGDGSEVKQRLRCDGLTVPRVAVALEVNDAVLMDDCQRNAWNTR